MKFRDLSVQNTDNPADGTYPLEFSEDAAATMGTMHYHDMDLYSVALC